jgi:F0F1-type ATP synthase membrane subunit b/b'
VDLESLENRAAGVSQKLGELEHLLRQEGRLRWLTAVAILAVLLVIIGLFWRAVHLVDPDQVVQIAQERSDRIAKDAWTALRDGLEKAYPKARANLEAKLSKHAPKIIETGEKELGNLLTNLNREIQKQVESEANSLEKDIRASLATEFPDLTDEKMSRMVKNVQTALEQICVEYAHEYLEEHAALLVKIEDTIMKSEAFAPREGEEIPRGEALMEELRKTAMDLLLMKVVRVSDVETTNE